MSSRVSSTMIFSPVVKDITACGENSIVSMRSQFTMISSPLIFLTTIMPKQTFFLMAAPCHHRYFIGSFDQVLQVKINGFKGFCELPCIEVLIQPVDRKAQIRPGAFWRRLEKSAG